MIDDLNQLPDNTSLSCDVCIIGSGAAGLAIAHELLGSKLKVVLVESGGEMPEAPSQALYESVIAELPFHGHLDGRARISGGSTTTWGGQSLRLGRLDFEPRDWVAHATGWPIRLDELIPYYQRASAFMLTDTLNFDTDIFKLLRFQPPAFNPAAVHYHYSKWSRRPSLRDTYGGMIRAATNTTLLLHANLTRIELSDDGTQVTELRIRSLKGKAAVIHPRQVVLATGGIETARILLSNNTQEKSGIGNGRDFVGRFFQDHPGAIVGAVLTDHPDEIQRLFNTFYHRGLKYAPRLSVSEAMQIEHRILNASAYLKFDTGDDSPYLRLKQAVGGLRHGKFGWQPLKHLLNGLVHLPAIARPVYEYSIRHRAYAPDPVIQLQMNIEQEPNPDSRIVLSDQTDALGIPRSEIRWRLTELTHRTIRVYAKVLHDEFEKLGLGRIEIAACFAADSPDWRRSVGDQYHHMGTARMSDSPEQGVVDRRCRVHGISNLRIAGSAVFPTSGHSNPTLTLLALAIRMADDLKAG